MTDLVDLRTAVRRSGAYLVIDGTWLQSRDALRGTGFDSVGRTARVIGDVLSYDWR